MAEALATDAAEVRLLPAVDPQVLPECGSLSDRFAAKVAGPLPLPSMGALYVPLSVACIVKLPSTNVTRKRS